MKQNTLLALSKVPAQFPNSNFPACLQALESVYSKALSTILWALGIAAFFALITGGFKFMVSKGDEKALESAKQTITFGVMGLVIAVASYAILLGIDLMVLKVKVGPLIQFTIPGTCTTP